MRYITLITFIFIFNFNADHSEAATITKYDQSQHGTYNVQIHLKNLELIAILDDTMFGGSENDVYDYDYTDVSAASNGTFNISLTTTTTTPSSSPTSTPAPPPSTTYASSTTSYASTTNKTNSNNNRLTTYINTKVTPKPNTGTKTNITSLKPNNVKYNTSINIISTTKSPNKLSNVELMNDQKIITAVNYVTSTTPSTIYVTTPNNDGSDSTHMDMVAIPVEIQNPVSASYTGASPSGAMIIKKCAPGYFRDSNGKCRRIRKPHLPFLQMVHTPGVIKSFQGGDSTTKKMFIPADLANSTSKGNTE